MYSVCSAFFLGCMLDGFHGDWRWCLLETFLMSILTIVLESILPSYVDQSG